jgi:serine/threonine protein kinase
MADLGEPSATKHVPQTPPQAETVVSPAAATPTPASSSGGVSGSGRQAPLVAGARIGAFKVVSHLGRGGMGDVYRAHDESLDRDVALKTISPALVADRDFIDRFHAEAKSAARIQHPNVVQVFSWGEDQGTIFFAMELVAGRSLGEHLRTRGSFAWQDAARLGIEIARGLEAAQTHGVIHRDVKPENILLADDGRLKVADFGLAKRVADAGTTASGVIVGTPRYMSPEQAQGDTLDARSDMYSLGATLFHMLAGVPVFDGSSPMKVCLRHIQETPPDLASLAPATPPQLVRCVARLLAKRREDRYATYAELVRDLEVIVASTADTRGGSALAAVPATVVKTPLLQVTKRPDGAVQVEVCPHSGQSSSLSANFLKARAEAPLAPVARRLVADAVDVGHLWLAYAVFSLIPILESSAPFPQVVAAVALIWMAVQYLTRHGGTVGERLMDVRLVTRAGGLPPHPAIGMGWLIGKAAPFLLGVFAARWNHIVEAFGGDVRQVASACSIIGGVVVLEYGLEIATGLSFRDRTFKTRVIDVRSLPPEDDWL